MKPRSVSRNLIGNDTDLPKEFPNFKLKTTRQINNKYGSNILVYKNKKNIYWNSD